MNIEQIIKSYPKTDDCELQTLGKLHEWQIKEITDFVIGFIEWYKSMHNGNIRNALEIYQEITKKE